MKKLAFFILCLSLAGILPQAAYSAELEDRFLKLREEEIQAKQRRVEDLSAQIEAMQNQMAQQKTEDGQAQDRVWKEFTGSLELERRQLQDQMTALEERQQLFEAELEKKRQQDQIRIQEQQTEISRMMNDLDRLRSELEEDKKMLTDRRQEVQALSGRAAAGAAVQNDAQSETLANNAIRITGVKGKEFSGGGMRGIGDINPEYYLEIGDIVDIEVWRVQDLTRAVTVRPDGRISLPLVGDVEVIGHTLTSLRDLLTREFSAYVLNPQVSLSVRQFGGRKFIILGEIRSPGVYRFQQDISLLEGIALAGGFSERAKRGKIMVIRGDIHKDPQVRMISANMENVLKKGMLTENITIRSGDVIYVGKDLLSDYNDIITNLIAPTLDTMTDYYVVRSAIRSDRRAEGNSSATT